MSVKANSNRLFVVVAVIVAALAMSLCLGFAQPQVASASVKSTNAKAHKAYKAKMNKLVQQSNMGVSYRFADITGDKIDECLVYGGYEAMGEFVFTYKSGKVKKLLNFSHGGFVAYYPKNKVTKVGTGHMGYNQTIYFQWNKKKKKLINAAGLTETYYDAQNNPIDTPVVQYFVKGNKVSKATYDAKVKKLTAGKKKGLNAKAYKPATTKAKAKPFAKAFLKSRNNSYSAASYVETGKGTCYYNGKPFIWFRGVYSAPTHDTTMWWVAVFKDGSARNYFDVVR